MYAQKIEGSSWRGEKLEKNKIDKMSGMEYIKSSLDPHLFSSNSIQINN